MAHRLDIVSVGIGDVCAVVVRVIVRTQAGRTVVAATGGKTGRVEGVDLGAAVGGEGDVGMRSNATSVAAYLEAGFVVAPEARRPGAVAGLLGRDFHDQ